MNTSSASTDRIEKEILLKASRSRVWQALSDAEAFGEWFGMALKGKAFVPGRAVQANITIQGFEHLVVDMHIERVEPEHLFSYRWHPYAVDLAIDYSQEPTTLVEFTLEEASGGTLLRVVESGFDRIPLARRAEAFRMNSGGWEAQIRNIETYLTAA